MSTVMGRAGLGDEEMGFRILRLVEICLWWSGILLGMVEIYFPGQISILLGQVGGLARI